MKRRVFDVLTGILIGVVFCSGATVAASGVTVVTSLQPIFVDGVRVEMEAYNINGNNYVKLRDIAEAVDFGLTWNNTTRTVEIDTGSPYEKSEPAMEQPTSDAEDSSTPVDMYAVREEIVRLTNDLRRENGLHALTMDDDLMAAAQVRAEEAAATITYSHTRPGGSSFKTAVHYQGSMYAGENMGMKDKNLAGIPEQLAEIQVESWAHSEGHRHNMLNAEFAAVGTGIAQDRYGMYYITQFFAGGDYTIIGVDTPIQGT